MKIMNLLTVALFCMLVFARQKENPSGISGLQTLSFLPILLKKMIIFNAVPVE